MGRYSDSFRALDNSRTLSNSGYSFGNMDDGEGINFNDLSKQKQEKDMKELQNLINAHFQERNTDQENFEEFKAKIDARKSKRAGEIEEKKQKEADKAKREAEEKVRREEEVTRLAKEKEESKQIAFTLEKRKYLKTTGENNWAERTKSKFESASFFSG